MSNKFIAKLLESYRSGYITADELVDILEKQFYATIRE